MDIAFSKKYGPWALIVGASEGLGAAFADNCAARGLNVILAARRQAALDTVSKNITQRHKVQTRCIVVDAGAQDCVDKIQKSVEGLEIGFFIYNAAAEPGGPFMRIALADHLNNIQVNVVTPTLLVHWLGQGMVARKRGGIVLVSSLAGEQGLPNWASYAAAKSYECILGEGLWDELRDFGVTATAYMVGATYTPAFMRIQKKLNLPFVEGYDPKSLPKDAVLPRTPEEVAAYLFPQLESGPRLYSSQEDKIASEASMKLDRATVITNWSKTTKTYYSGGLNELTS